MPLSNSTNDGLNDKASAHRKEDQRRLSCALDHLRKYTNLLLHGQTPSSSLNMNLFWDSWWDKGIYLATIISTENSGNIYRKSRYCLKRHKFSFIYSCGCWHSAWPSLKYTSKSYFIHLRISNSCYSHFHITQHRSRFNRFSCVIFKFRGLVYSSTQSRRCLIYVSEKYIQGRCQKYIFSAHNSPFRCATQNSNGINQNKYI